MTDPNEGIVEQYAQHLLKRAATAVLSWTVMGVILGAFLGGLPRLFRHNLISPSKIYFAVLLGAIAGGFLGRSLGEKRAVGLRLQAQMAMRQLELETKALFARVPAPVAAPAPVPVAAPVAPPPVAPPPVAPAAVAPAPAAPAPVAAPLPPAPAVEPLLAPPPAVVEPAPAPVAAPAPAAPPFPVVATPVAPAPPVMPAIRTEATGSVSLPPLTAPPLSG